MLALRRSLAQRLALHGLLVQLQLASTLSLLLLTPNRPLALQHISPTLGRQCTLAALRNSSDVLPPCMPQTQPREDPQSRH
jgi:hypothetical protein